MATCMYDENQDEQLIQEFTGHRSLCVSSGGSRISRWGGGGALIHWGGVLTSDTYTFGKNICKNKRNGSCWGACAGNAPLDLPMVRHYKHVFNATKRETSHIIQGAKKCVLPNCPKVRVKRVERLLKNQTKQSNILVA